MPDRPLEIGGCTGQVAGLGSRDSAQQPHARLHRGMECGDVAELVDELERARVVLVLQRLLGERRGRECPGVVVALEIRRRRRRGVT